MHKATQKERETFVRRFIEHGYGTEFEKESLARRLLRAGATIGRVAEQACNGPGSPPGLTAEQYNRAQARWQKYQDAQEAKAERLESNLARICAAFGCQLVTQGDPRGATLRVIMPDGYGDSSEPRALCVPTS